MILVTIGTQLPFDRLIEAVDEIAKNTDEPIFAQIGNSHYLPRHIDHTHSISPPDFDAKFAAARVIVAHAGIGTVLSAQKHQKPLVLMPREARYGEHRNDHQLATCAQLAGTRGIYVVRSQQELADTLLRDDLQACDSTEAASRRSVFVKALRDTISDVLART